MTNSKSAKTVGILALQGDFEAHRKAFEKLGAHVVEVRTTAEMAACDGLVLPGGESTTMLKLLEQENLLDPLRAFGRFQQGPSHARRRAGGRGRRRQRARPR